MHTAPTKALENQTHPAARGELPTAVPHLLGRNVWIDLDNTPHVPFFAPIITKLKQHGCKITLTGRDAYQVSEMVKLYGLDCRCIGRHYGKHPIMKALGTVIRAVQLLPVVFRAKPDLAVAHCSRGQLLVSKLLRIPTIWISDYEFATGIPFLNPDLLMMPEVIPPESVQIDKSRVVSYPGIKEDVYVPTFRPDGRIKQQLGLRPGELLITLRPPADEAHYHTQRSDDLFRACMEYLGNVPGLKIAMLPRNARQAAKIRQDWCALLESGKVVVPSHAVDGLNLIWHSDLMISGGGTMNREAAALGVPVYSIFGGSIGSVDRHLMRVGRLILLETENDVRTKINLVPRDTSAPPSTAERPALGTIVNVILSALQGEEKSTPPVAASTASR